MLNIILYSISFQSDTERVLSARACPVPKKDSANPDNDPSGVDLEHPTTLTVIIIDVNLL
jgi:hypothetical protein